ncbi:MAG TPA: aminomethyl-transferring glycine dehydrogenase subunit GcvPA [Acidimicrobiales bacterium]
MGSYIPHTDDEVESMLAFLGLSSLEELFAVVPEALKLQRGLELADGVGEPDVMARMEGFADRNRARSDHLICFAGGGAYDHEIPSVTRSLAGRSEFVTSYTPYQPEVAQGVLQAVFEYQTMVARLAGLPVANASLYDGGSAAVEAVNLGVAASGRETVWLSAGIHPHWRQMLATCAAGTGHRIATVPLVDGVTAWPDVGPPLDDPPGVLVVGYPNYLGCIEDLAAARAICDRTGALLVVGADPVAAGLLKSAGSWGADVVVGEGQVFGTGLGFGGPYLGLFACASAHVRRLPGRLVGETVDVEGRRAYVTTLRAREQDIRREKATSNVCTNQTLMAVTAAIQLGWLGTSGLVELARRCAQATKYTRDAVLALDGVDAFAGAPVLREFAIRLPIPAAVAVERMADAGFLAGIPLAGEFDDGEHGLLVSVTERRTRDEVDAYVTALAKAVAS